MHPELNQKQPPKSPDPAKLSPEERAQLAPGEQPVVDLDDTGALSGEQPSVASGGDSLPREPHRQSSAPAGAPKAHDKERLASPASPQGPSPDETKEKIGADVERILKEAQLPERHAFRAGADTPKADTTDAKPPLQQALEKNAAGHADAPVTPSTPADSSPKADGQTPEENTQDQVEEQRERSIIPSMRTIKDDLQHLVHSSKMSLVRAASLEQAKQRGLLTPDNAMQKDAAQQKQHDNPVRSRKRRRIIGITFAVVALIVLGGGALMVVSVVMLERQGSTQTQSVTDDSLIFTEQTFTLSIDSASSRTLLQQLANARNAVSLTLGAITRIVPVTEEVNPETGAARERSATTQEFLRALNTNAPDGVLRFISEDFFLGIHTIDQNAPVFIVPVTSYERVFAGMIEWEEDINADLSPFFTFVPRERATQAGDVVPTTFEDVIVRNFDVRVLRDAAGEIRMLYAFPTREILIIAESPHTFVEALARLRAERKL